MADFYTGGPITLTAGSANFSLTVGILQVQAKPGDVISLPNGRYGVILTITGDATGTLDHVWPAPSVVGEADYKIYHRGSEWNTNVLINEQLADILSSIEANDPTSMVENDIIRQKLTADLTLYVGAELPTLAVSIGSPAVVSTTSPHGLAPDDPIYFYIKPNRTPVTITIATPGVVTWNSHGFPVGQPIKIKSTGTLPTGLVNGTTYFVIAAGLTTNSFRLSATPGGAAINTTGSQSGTHYAETAGTFPTGIALNTPYYVLAAGLASTSFRFSTAPGGAAVNTSGTTTGRLSARTGNATAAADGSVATKSAAFFTINQALDYVGKKIDQGPHNLVIQLSQGFHPRGILIGPFNEQQKSSNTFDEEGSQVIIRGDIANPGNYCVNSLTLWFVPRIYVQGVHLRDDTADPNLAQSCIGLADSYVDVSNCEIGYSYWGGIYLEDMSTAWQSGPLMVVESNNGAIFYATQNSLYCQSDVVTLIGNPTNGGNGFAAADKGGVIKNDGVASPYVGVANGLRGFFSMGAIVGTDFPDTDMPNRDTYFPGDIPAFFDETSAFCGVLGDTLTADRTYYVNPLGTDENVSGYLGRAPGTNAFKTIQFALTEVLKLDIGDFTVTIQCAAGTYAGNLNAFGPTKYNGGIGAIQIRGDIATPANCIINCGASGYGLYAFDVTVDIRGFRLIGTGGCTGLWADLGGWIAFGNMDFHLNNAGAKDIEADNGGIAVAAANYSITSPTGYHALSQFSGVVHLDDITITVTGTPAWAVAMVGSYDLGLITCFFSTITGSATGKRYENAAGGWIDTAGGGANKFPGSVAGTGANYA